MLEISETTAISEQVASFLSERTIVKVSVRQADTVLPSITVIRKTIRPYPNCGSEIVKEAYPGGAVYYCPAPPL